MQVCGQEFSGEILQWIRQTVHREPALSRRALSRRICERLSWCSPNGRYKQMSCRVALQRLEQRGLVALPPVEVPRSLCTRNTHREVPPILEVRTGLAALGTVELVAVGNRGSRAAGLWMALMQRYHYLGAGPLCGAQLRYLIRSEHHGWVGALAFSAAAWRVEARDAWIGWTEMARRRHLSEVVANSRFLILPHVRVPHLASHVLALSMRQLPEDWQRRYGYRPLLVESFVDASRFRGTCYRAANWTWVGRTRGRGRQDRTARGGKTVKEVFVYGLHPRARQILCREPDHPGIIEETIRPAEDWTVEEFGGVCLGDARLEARVRILAADLYAKPQASLPQACGSRAKTKAAYRFFDHERTTMNALLQSHYEATRRRAGAHGTVLAVQDTTTLDYAAHQCTEGLGPVNNETDRAVGLLLHDTMAFSSEGTPLGLVDVQCWARDPEDRGKSARRHDLPIEQKESFKWLKSFQAAVALQKACSQTRVVSVGDREADIYELLELATADTHGPKLLVRATRERLLDQEQGRLWEWLSQEPVRGIQELHVPRQKNRKARVARLQVRFAAVSVKPPKKKPKSRPVHLWAVLAIEENAPEGIEPLEWMLLTTAAVNDFSEACERLAWYAQRWGIEVYHKTLKSGCKIEQRQLGSADRLETCLAIDLVVAWLIYHLAKLGRETPEVPCTVYFEESEWKALVSFVTRNPIPPEKPPSLNEAMRMVAGLGGFLGRKGDGEPGAKTLWLGLQRLDDLTAMWVHMTLSFAPHLLSSAVSREPGYG